MEIKNYPHLLEKTQEFISRNYGDFLTQPKETQETRERLKKRIESYLFQHHSAVLESCGNELVERLYEDMNGYGFIAKYLRNLSDYPDIEEININRWDSVVLKHSDGTSEFLDEHFLSPQQALDIIRRIVESKDGQFDYAVPYAESFIQQNVRLTAYMPPLIPESYGVSAFIRIVRTGSAANYTFVPITLSQEQEDFLYSCVEYKVSGLIAGDQGSGKTSLLNHLLYRISGDQRTCIIEEGSPELGGLDKYDKDKLKSQYISMLTRPASDERQNFDCDKLLASALRGDFDYIILQEMRKREAYVAQEAAHTGAGVYSTVHTNSARLAYGRCATLMKKAINYDESSLKCLAVEAFPIVIYMRKTGKVRRIMEILEGEKYDPKDGLKCRTLFRYHVTDNIMVDGIKTAVGSYEKVHGISKGLQDLFLDHGAPAKLIAEFAKEG